MKKPILFFILGFIGLVVILLVRTALLDSQQLDVDSVAQVQILDEDSVVDHLSAALRFKTVSSQDSLPSESQPFLEFHQYLEQVYPESHRTLQREIITGKSLLFIWPGYREELQPVLLLAHLDVVPAETGAESSWTHPPFAGQVEEGYIWGRGALDDKVRVLATFEAVERLIREGFRPERTVYFAFGHDEEIGGYEGAQKIAALLNKRGITFEMVLDEGGGITKDVFPGVSGPLALIGIAEKGYLTLVLNVRGKGGHSSMPPSHTAIGILSSAIQSLESYQFPGLIQGVTAKVFEYLAPEMSFRNRVMLANLWLFGPLVTYNLSSNGITNAMISTTRAVTMVEGGTQDNILPAQAWAVVNLRILPGDTIENVSDQVRQAINDPRVAIRPLRVGREPSSESRVDSWGYATLNRTIHEIFSGVLVSPYLVLGGTDSYHYQDIATDIYRFSPIRVTKDDLKRIHGVDERISIQNYLECVRFYYQFIPNLTS